jgi:hypothetical protein
MVIGGAVVAIALVLVVSGVGGSSTPTVPSSTVAQAAAATAKLRGFRMALTGSMRIPSADREMPLAGNGVIDRQAGTASIHMTISDLPGVPGGKMTTDEVLRDFVMYMHSPSFARRLPGGKSWMKVDLRKPTQQFGVDPSQISNDPAKALDRLRAVSGRVERLGTETVRGARTTHYRATVDLRRYPRLVPPARREAASRGVEKLIALTGQSRVPQDVWIDAQRHIRRFAVKLSFHLATLPGRPEVAMKLDEQLYAFGTPVQVRVPAGDEVFDATKLAGRQAQSALSGQ